MSPSESDLRAALRDGEGDGVNVDQLILGVRADVTRRKVRLLTTLSIVGVLACGGGTVGALVATSHGTEGTSSSPAQAAGGMSGDLAAPHAAGSPVFGEGVGGSATGTASCPAGEDSVTTAGNAGGGGGGKVAQNPRAEIFDAQVSAVLVCTYGDRQSLTTNRTNDRPQSVLLRGVDANRLVASLEQASTTKPTGVCPYARGQQSGLLMIGLSADGSVAGTARTVLGMPACNVVVFGTGAPRYGWRLPVELAPRLRALTRVALPTAKVIGSPVSS